MDLETSVHISELQDRSQYSDGLSPYLMNPGTDWLIDQLIIKNVPKSPVKPAIFSTTVCLNRVCHFLFI